MPELGFSKKNDLDQRVSDELQQEVETSKTVAGHDDFTYQASEPALDEKLQAQNQARDSSIILLESLGLGPNPGNKALGKAIQSELASQGGVTLRRSSKAANPEKRMETASNSFVGREAQEIATELLAEVLDSIGDLISQLAEVASTHGVPFSALISSEIQEKQDPEPGSDPLLASSSMRQQALASTNTPAPEIELPARNTTLLRFTNS